MKRSTRRTQPIRLTAVASITADQFASIALQDSPERAYMHLALQSNLFTLGNIGAALREYEEEMQIESLSNLISRVERNAERAGL